MERLREEVERLRKEILELREALGDRHSKRAKPSAPEAPGRDQKVRLFWGLFRGREDVYAYRWVSSKTGKAGYSPARRSGRPRYGNDEDYLPLDERVLIAHLTGRQTIGIYPLLKDETCRLLAVDFDKVSWRDDSAAFREVCLELGVPIALERSRSGNGSHAWIFFESPLPARTARQMGCALLTLTMENRFQLGLDSYDRLFPSQDTLPKGGFGNLIALPLQGGSRKSGNTIFLDEYMEPLEDQWKFLSSIERLDHGRVDEIVRDARTHGRLIGVPIVSEDEQDLPSRQSTLSVPHLDLQIDLSNTVVQITRADQVFVSKRNLVPSAINHLIRTASFQNPEFYRFQAMRLSTFSKPRVICCSQDHGDVLALPRGCLEDVRRFLEQAGATLHEVDERTEGSRIRARFRGELTSVQQEALAALTAQDIGVLSAHPAFGKTVVAAAVIATRQVNTLVLVHRRQLLDQWRDRLATFLKGVDQVGQIGGGKHSRTGILDVAMLQTLNRKGQVKSVIKEYGQIIVDECHHISALRFEQVLSKAPAKYVVGLTATPIRRDGHHPIIFMQCGPIRYRRDQKKTNEKRELRQIVIPRMTDFALPDESEEVSIQRVMAMITEDTRRNDLIFDDVVEALEHGKSPILLTERISHLEHFHRRLELFCKNVFIFRGRMAEKQRTDQLRQLARLPDEEERLILATGRCIGEGFDEPHLDTLFLAMPIAWKGILQQYVGRLQRSHPDKHEIQVYDYVDDRVPVLQRMFGKRRRGYRALGYEIRSPASVK